MDKKIMVDWMVRFRMAQQKRNMLEKQFQKTEDGWRSHYQSLDLQSLFEEFRSYQC